MSDIQLLIMVTAITFAIVSPVVIIVFIQLRHYSNGRVEARDNNLWAQLSDELKFERKKRRELEIRVNQMIAGVTILINQLQQAGIAPAWTLDAQQLSANYLRNIPAMMDEHFSMEELRALAFELGAEFDNLPSDTRLGKSIDLWEWAEHNECVPDLLNALRQKRPHVRWQEW